MVYVQSAEYWPGFTHHGDNKKRREMELDGFVNVGDIGHVDEDGYLHLNERANDMVISGGVNIPPAEIESVLYQMAAVRDCAVFGIPDEEFGESVTAHIEVGEGFEVPKVVVFDSNLPREDSGKLFKRKIRDRYWQEADARI